MNNENKLPPSEATHSGFHTYDLFQKCERKFFIRFVKGIKTLKTAHQLTLGAAFHHGKEIFYTTKDKQKALEACTNYIKARKMAFDDPDQYLKTFTRCPTMLESWIDEVGFQDLEDYNVFAVEKYLEIPLPNNFRVTMRLDGILQHKKSGNYLIMETKSTQSGADNMIIQVQNGDQATIYTWGFKIAYPDLPLLGVVPDITFWSKASKNPKLIKNIRPTDLIVRTKRDFAEYELCMQDLIETISNRVKRYESGESEFSTFKRDTYWCNSYYKPCEYMSICRGCDLDEDLPPGFIKERPALMEEL